jgi:hypothetical protein
MAINEKKSSNITILKDIRLEELDLFNPFSLH